MSKGFFLCQLAKFRIVWGIRLYNALRTLTSLYKPADCGVWVSVDFDSKYKMLWGETRVHGVPMHEEEKKFKQEST